MLKRTASGYHQIQTILQETPEVNDEVKIISAKDSDHTSIVYTPKFTPPKTPIHENDNLAHKALLLLKKTYKIKKFATITITKNIPLSSGLGGASSDAAATLKGLNKLWNLKISTRKILTLAAKLGMDVPFFIIGGTALCTHFGEKITPLAPIKNIKFKISPKSAEGSSEKSHTTKTGSTYSSLDLSLCGKNITKTKALLKAIKSADKKSIIASLHNDFETLTPQKDSHHLSGSGPSTFIII